MMVFSRIPTARRALSLALGAILITTLMVLGQPRATFAQDAEATAAPAAPPPAWLSKLSFEAYADLFYAFNFANHGKRGEGPGPANRASALRAFDSRNQTFDLSMVKLGLGIAPDDQVPIGARIDLFAGTTAFDVGDLMPVLKGPNQFGFGLEQAYFTLKFGDFTLDAGQFVTSAGAELLEAGYNYNHSHGLLFWYAIPVAHTGIRMSYAVVPDMLTVQWGLQNGWDAHLDGADVPTINLSVAATPMPETSLYFNFYTGPYITGNLDHWQHLLDLVVVHDFGAATLRLNLDLGLQQYEKTPDKDGVKPWWGISLATRVPLHEFFAIAARYEFFSDIEGTRIGLFEPVTDKDPWAMSITLTLEVPLWSYGVFRVEYRRDQLSEKLFLDGKDKPTNGQDTLMFALTGWFK